MLNHPIHSPRFDLRCGLRSVFNPFHHTLSHSTLQGDARFDLRSGLSSLPTPKNDYEIVIPEGDEDENVMDGEGEDYVEDAEDVEHRRAEVGSLACD